LTETLGDRVRNARFNTRGQIYKAPDIIEHFSRYMPLRTGDVFAYACTALTALLLVSAMRSGRMTRRRIQKVRR